MKYKTHQDYLNKYKKVITEIISLLKDNSVNDNVQILEEVKREINERSFLKER